MARRLWRAFSVGRMVTALVLVALLLAMVQINPQRPQTGSSYATLSLLVGYGYLLVAVINWVVLRHTPPKQPWGLPWLFILAGEVAAICLIQLLQLLQPGSSTLHFSPLLALPVLTAACLGSLRMAWATTAIITLLLLGGHSLAVWYGLPGGVDSIVQAAMVCLGYFVIAWLTHHLAHRLAWQEHLARKNHRLAQTQAQINSLIITQLSEGVLVVDGRDLKIHQTNPAALELLGCQISGPAPTHLHAQPLWEPLCDLLKRCLQDRQGLSESLLLQPPGKPPVGLYVRVWLSQWSLDDGLPGSEHPFVAEEQQPSAPAAICLVFLEDLRELEARLRTEKMAAMGRISAAVAHEIRNPLAAITQANALLQEDLQDATQQRLAKMVADNAQRLANTVEDVLDIARVQQQAQHPPAPPLELDAALLQIWQDWQAQQPLGRLGQIQLSCPGSVPFEGEHLRRIVVNLLDNALRHCQGDSPQRLQLLSGRSLDGQAWLQVWSQGPEIEATVQAHLFEPFFSSQSRSSGLGLFICRELCERHGASIGYQRGTPGHLSQLPHPSLHLAAGNGFNVYFAPSSAQAALA